MPGGRKMRLPFSMFNCSYSAWRTKWCICVKGVYTCYVLRTLNEKRRIITDICCVQGTKQSGR